jgi:hypothetical protein
MTQSQRARARLRMGGRHPAAVGCHRRGKRSMQYQARRPRRGASRDTPEDILRRAIAWHRAIKAREAQQATRENAGAHLDEPVLRAAAREADGEAKRRAAFAGAMARAVFGRGYWKEGGK